ncbi:MULTISPECIES: ferrous iron transporter B [Diaphorobacter]|uniref:Ferrous iron transport protein B n=2 Tax=Diaphorobacter TaxID=238749 RepID=A0AAX1WUD9_9BURK|nr:MULTISPECIES: ferrous iron transporter B [Diaphorobacter]ROR47333.1 ferrous iron transport protein B [Diaphorobacter nitroreducens]WKK91199.1 ferrous iron transporter B [Diaphorobacter sp. C33]
MSTAASPLHIALLGNPNCGKTALFNVLTGARQKVANYAGVTVERKEGLFTTASGRRVRVLDLPGAYSLHAQSLDEAVTRDVVTGRRPGEAMPELLVCVTDATHLRLNLRLVLEARDLGLPMVLVLNMSDMAQQQGIQIDREVLARELGLPVVTTVGVRADGARELLQWLDTATPQAARGAAVGTQAPPPVNALEEDRPQRVQQLHQEVRRIMGLAVREPALRLQRDDRIDAVVLHPLWGMLLLAVTLFLMFQAVFSWAEVPMGWIEGATAAVAEWLNAHMAEGPLRSLLADGVIAGAGGVLVFLPQILILFFFILALEESGYLPRAAFLLDRVMGTVGLSGRSFIPLLSSFACAVPGIMATRSIPDWRDRLVTILIAPLMTCSARLPVYALLIAAFIPDRTVAGLFNLQGLVLFALYLGGIVSAMAVAAVARLARRGDGATPLLMELPAYRWPSVRNLALGLWERAGIFLRRVGGIILLVTILLWFLSSYPAPPADATGPAIEYSFAGRIGAALEVIFAPIGFNWQISIALVPGMAAREVAVSALGTVYAIAASADDTAAQLAPMLAAQWSLATALSLLVWFIFAPQCVSTIAAVRRETNGWRWPLVMTGYLFALAYAASFITYRVALALGGG